MTFNVTLSLLAVFAVILVLTLWAERRPRDPLKPRLIPLPYIQFVAVLGVVLMLAHLITLMTGHQFTGKRPWLHGS
jgi:drug/metabolite transporter (DMT)-like permease